MLNRLICLIIGHKWKDQIVAEAEFSNLIQRDCERCHCNRDDIAATRALYQGMRLHHYGSRIPAPYEDAPNG